MSWNSGTKGQAGNSAKFSPKEPTNASIARKIGLTNAGVSRIRNGNRVPSSRIIRVIEAEYGFSAIDQYNAILEGNYAEEFEKAISGTV